MNRGNNHHLSRGSRTWALILAYGLVVSQLALIGPAPVDAATPNGGEFRINDANADPQYTRKHGSRNVSMWDGGNSVAAWWSEAQDADGNGQHNIYVRVLGPTGSPLTGEIRANADQTGDQDEVAVGTASTGNFVVTWAHRPNATTDEIYARVFNSAGTPQTGDLQVNQTSSGTQAEPSITVAPNGDFIVVWQGEGPGDTDGVFARRYNANGTPKAGEVLVNSTTPGVQANPVVATDSTGNFIVTWDGSGVGGEAAGIFGRRINSDGTFRDATEFLINTASALTQDHSSVSMDADGDFIVAWTHHGASKTVHAKLFDPLLATPGEFVVPTTGGIEHSRPSASMAAAGDFSVSWQSSPGDADGWGVLVRDYAAGAIPLGSDLVVNISTASAQKRPGVGLSPDGNSSIVVWEGNGTQTGHVDNQGVFGRTLIPEFAQLGISGRVFNDIAGDGLADGIVGDALNPAVDNVDVYLYGDSNSSGSPDAGDALVGGPIQTDGSGAYRFVGIPDDTYWLVVDSKTISGNTAVWAEQTYGPDQSFCADGLGATTSRIGPGACYSGRNGGVSDDASSLLTAEHVARVDLTTEAANRHFGFSTNVVTTTRGGDTTDDDGGGTARTIQGSLRQFIQNANALAGADAMRFVPTETTNQTAGPGTDWWRITVSADIPIVSSNGVTVDGTAYELDGITLRNANNAGIGAGVGVGTTGTYTTPTLDPELELTDGGSIINGLHLQGDSIVVRHLSMSGFDYELQLEGATNAEIDNNVLGTGPAAFSAIPSGIHAIQLDATSVGVNIHDNLIGFKAQRGVQVYNGSNTVTIQENEIRDLGSDGIDIALNSSDVDVIGNLITGAENYAIDDIGPRVDVIDNTITGNGTIGLPNQVGGIRLFSADHVVQYNVISNNAGDAVNVAGRNDANSRPPAIRTLVSQNVFGDNTDIAIDLTAHNSDVDIGDGITANTGGTIADHGNDGIDTPVIATADASGAVSGTACANCSVEIYQALPDADGSDEIATTGYGEGIAFLTTVTADGAGAWTATGLSLTVGSEVSAITLVDTDADLTVDSTSEFAPNLTVASGVGNAYAVAASSSQSGANSQLTRIDEADADPATNEILIGNGTGAAGIEGLSRSPVDGQLYAARNAELGLIDSATGAYTPVGPFGSGSGPVGIVTMNDVQAIAFDAATGQLFGVHRRTAGDTDLLFEIDPATGSIIADAFGVDEYVEIQNQATRHDVTALAIDPADGTAYGMMFENTNYRLVTINLTDGSTGNNGSLADLTTGFSFDASGQLWAVGTDTTNDYLYRLDKTDGTNVLSQIQIDNADDYRALALPPPVLFTISGSVYDDALGMANPADFSGHQNVNIRVYQDNAPLGARDASDTQVVVKQTDSGGNFAVPVTEGNAYWIVAQTDGSGAWPTDIWPEQTYGSAGSLCDDGGAGITTRGSAGPCYGGVSGDVSDAASTGLLSSEHVIYVPTVSAAVNGVEFAFATNVVTNIRAGDGADDDPAFIDRTVQGSLRQFITNANNRSGADTMRFVPVSSTNASGNGQAWWTIPITTQLPPITEAFTTIDGTGYSHIDGTTVLTTNTAPLGYVGPVGTGPDAIPGNADDPTLIGLDGPELEIVGDGSSE
ncbi:MAG: right-handed parallel beta-helix repeat-containing protein, partial [Acidimicrobiia bacterium]|nr:right-handed parallel beta-helix repeat-containing protein [Acidimicrobiia bacterium]